MHLSKRIYLISPPTIPDIAEFTSKLSSLLILYGDYIFAVQLRVKNAQAQCLFNLGMKIGEICHKYNVLLIVNDSVEVAHDLYIQGTVDGLHIGQQDKQLAACRRILPSKMIVGISCYDQLDLARKCTEEGANYVSFGAFFPSKTKLDTIAQPKVEILHQWRQDNKIPAVAIGGITADNCAEFFKVPNTIIALCNYIWSHVKSPLDAMQSIITHNN